ncbi:replication factor C subunit 3-like [Sycon ciliatum]|uniref:replication factor C subunit 3-like n=1 Tax=Sycon ciliatum TaxID=27933 RepID=UPI0020A91938|eukprot:scpid55578/ scgid7860/ Replication factor C subunit 3; Activator 1 38 kDa subunit; Activator 1 subunit 3; Replication factor C 38 kDa subunit
MSLWVDKYRPTSLDKLDYHRDQADQLRRMVKSGDFPHLLVFGPSGAGKKTRIMCLLREVYGAGVEKLRVEHQEFTTPSNKKLEVTTIASNYHIEVNPSDAGLHDRVIIQDIIKGAAQTQQLDAASQRNFKVIILSEVDRLTKDAQHALRRTMEKYVASCRLILCCNSPSKVIPAVRSRCLSVRVPAPTLEEISGILSNTCRVERVQLPVELAERIAEYSGRNLRRALLTCEACYVQQQPFSADQTITENDWEIYLKQTASLIIEQQSPARLMEVRTRLYELLTRCIPADIIMKGLLDHLAANCDGSLKTEVTALAARYEHRLQLGSKTIYHIEAFIANFMKIYKRFLEEGMHDMF